MSLWRWMCPEGRSCSPQKVYVGVDSWQGKQFLKKCSLWEGPTLENVVKDCILWEGPRAGAGEEIEKEKTETSVTN